MKLRRSALLCLLFAAGAQLASGCYCCNRPFLFRPWCNNGCWPHCYQPAGGMSMGGEPGCASCFSAPSGIPVAQGPGPVFTGGALPIQGPTIQQIPMGTPMPTTGTPKTGN